MHSSLENLLLLLLLLEAEVVLLRQLIVEHEELEMHHPDPVHTVVVDVLGPGAALDVEELTELGLRELNGDDGAAVVALVLVGEVLGREAAGGGVVLDGAELLEIGGVLSLAVHPNLVLVLLLDDVLPEGLGHVVRNVVGVVEGLVLNAIQLVQLDEDARLALVVAVVALGARSQVRQLELARLVPAGPVLLGAHLATAVVVGEEAADAVGPDAPAGNVAGALLAVLVEDDHGGVDGVLRLRRPETHTRGRANQTGRAEPFGLVVLDGEHEDVHHECPEGGQQGVVDDVEDGDEPPGLGGSAHDGAMLTIVEEVFDGIPSMALNGLDGGATQEHGGFSRHLGREVGGGARIGRRNTHWRGHLHSSLNLTLVP